LAKIEENLLRGKQVVLVSAKGKERLVFGNVVTQFWIHQDFLKCYFIYIIIYKNPKKLRKRKIQKYIFLESTASFHKNRFHRVNTGQTMSAK